MAAVDHFTKFNSQLDSPARKAVVVTPHNTNELTNTTRALYIGGAGNVEVILAGDTSSVIFYSVPAGTFLPLRVKQVRAAGTTATNILALE